MRSGRVLVVGGCIGDGVCTERVDIFNPQTNSWSEAMPLESHRASHSAQLLDDGRVLVAGGGGELPWPAATRCFTTRRPMPGQPRDLCSIHEFTRDRCSSPAGAC